MFTIKITIFCENIGGVYKKPPLCKASGIYRVSERAVILGQVCMLFRSFREAASSGSGSLTHTHHHLYIPIKNTLTVTCGSILPSFKSATYRTSISIGRIYVQPSTNIGVIDCTRKSPQRVILMDRF